MPVQRRSAVLLFAAVLISFSIFANRSSSLARQSDYGTQAFLPVIVVQSVRTSPPSPTPPPDQGDWLGWVNYYRSQSGVPTVSQDAVLNDNCWQHARYMAENDVITHNQDPSLLYASDAGQYCAQRGNAWLGASTQADTWHVADTIEGWMDSVGHRLWLLYPTTPTFGYGFYSTGEKGGWYYSGAALDVLSHFNSGADAAYPGWPVRYPGPDQGGVPASRYPITLMWRYFSSTPAVSSTSLTTLGGQPIAHQVITDPGAAANHRYIELLPSSSLPDDTVFIVSVSGSHNGAPFSQTWRFATGEASVP